MADTSLSEKRIGLLVWYVSNFWQTKLRNILKHYQLSLNEYLILESIYYLKKNVNSITQTQISIFSGIDISVVSICLKSLYEKNLVFKQIDNDNRKKIITFHPNGNKLFNEIYPKISQEESDLFDKLKNERFNFCNSLKLILGKKIRIKANKYK